MQAGFLEQNVALRFGIVALNYTGDKILAVGDNNAKSGCILGWPALVGLRKQDLYSDKVWPKFGGP
jgi:hypothetical protein